MRASRFLPLGIGSLARRAAAYDLSPEAVLAVAAPEHVGLPERALKLVLAVGITIVGLFLGSVVGLVAGRWLTDVTGWAWMEDLLNLPVIAVGLIVLPMAGGMLAERLLSAVWPRSKVPTLALDGDRVIVALPAAFGTGLTHEVFRLVQGTLAGGQTAEETLAIFRAASEDLELPRLWRTGGKVVGHLARHPRKEATHELCLEQGFLVLRRRPDVGGS